MSMRRVETAGTYAEDGGPAWDTRLAAAAQGRCVQKQGLDAYRLCVAVRRQHATEPVYAATKGGIDAVYSYPSTREIYFVTPPVRDPANHRSLLWPPSPPRYVAEPRRALGSLAHVPSASTGGPSPDGSAPGATSGIGRGCAGFLTGGGRQAAGGGRPRHGRSGDRRACGACADGRGGGQSAVAVQRPSTRTACVEGGQPVSGGDLAGTSSGAPTSRMLSAAAAAAC